MSSGLKLSVDDLLDLYDGLATEDLDDVLSTVEDFLKFSSKITLEEDKDRNDSVRLNEVEKQFLAMLKKITEVGAEYASGTKNLQPKLGLKNCGHKYAQYAL